MLGYIAKPQLLESCNGRPFSPFKRKHFQGFAEKDARVTPLSTLKCSRRDKHPTLCFKTCDFYTISRCGEEVGAEGRADHKFFPVGDGQRGVVLLQPTHSGRFLSAPVLNYKTSSCRSHSGCCVWVLLLMLLGFGLCLVFVCLFDFVF